MSLPFLYATVNKVMAALINSPHELIALMPATSITYKPLRIDNIVLFTSATLLNIYSLLNTASNH